MNTKQLIALWYTGLTVAALLLFSNGEIPFLKNEWEVFIIDVAIIGAMSVFTLRSGNQLDWRSFLRWVVPAIVVPVIGIGALIAYYHVRTEALPASELAKVKLDGSPNHYGDGSVFGRIYNGSSYTITKVTLRITSEGFVDPDEDKKLQERRKEENSWTREYADDVIIPPLSSGLVNVTVSSKNSGALMYEIANATGYRSN